MTFVNLKHLKETVSQATKISDRNNAFVIFNLSKSGQLSLHVLFGVGSQVIIPVESQTIKDRSQVSDKATAVSIEILSKIVRNLPVLLEEVEIAFTPPGLVITGGYGEKKVQSKLQTEQRTLYSMRYELRDESRHLRCCQYDFTEEKILSFSTGADIASVLADAAKIAQQSPTDKLDNVFLSCKEDEILVTGTDGHRLCQKYIYAQDNIETNIDLVISSELGVAIGKFAFQDTHWEIYQNFVKVTLDDSVEIFATRPLMPDFPNFQQWNDKSCHTTLVIDSSELKARLNKLKKDVWLWLYTVENRLAIECFEGDSVGIFWVKNTLKVPPALVILNARQLLNTLKTVKKGTSQIKLLLPKLVAEDESEVFFNDAKNTRNVAYLEFNKNSHLIAGKKKSGLPTPPGVRDWLIARGWSILPESKPPSTAAKSAVKILSDRWTGKGWERPELVACDCGTVHDESILQPQLTKLSGYCEHCEDYRELALYQIDYRCTGSTCNTLNRAMVDLPLPNPKCMQCGKEEFTTLHHFECRECERPVMVNNCKACPCGTILEEDVSMWQCGACESTFFVDDICDEADLQYLQGTELDTIFVGCPCCERFDVELTSSPMYSCHECGSITHDSFYVPAIEAPALPCPECNQDLSDIPPQKINDPFVVGSVTRF